MQEDICNQDLLVGTSRWPWYKGVYGGYRHKIAMSLSMGSRCKKASASRKIQPNPKYSHIEAKVTTGSSVNAYMKELDNIRKNYRFRKGELFKRIKCTTLVELIWEVAMEYEEARRDWDELHAVASDSDNSVDEMVKGSPDRDNTKKHNRSSASTMHSVITGRGEVDVRKKSGQNHETKPPVDDTFEYSMPYLLLDVRDLDAYESCRIVGAKSYPATMLNRSVNYFTKEIQSFINIEGKLIVVYDEDERIASTAATVMCEKGLDNIFMLSGGLKVLHKKFPMGVIAGKIPSTCISPPPPGKGKKRLSDISEAPISLRLTRSNLESLRESIDRNIELDQRSSVLTSRSSMTSRVSVAPSMRAPSKASSSWR